MNKIEYYKLSKDEKNALWSKATIVFDTSTLGNLYCMAEEPKKTLLEIFGIVKSRLWLPAHVVYEYKKNREALIENSFAPYGLPKQGVYVNRYEAEMDAFLKDNDNDTYHPYLEPSSLDKIKVADKVVREKLQLIRKEIKEQYAKRKASLQQEIADDIVNKLVDNLMQGTPFSFQQQMSIVKEGEFRYRNLIPPGYEDAPPFNQKKKGLQRYGDLLIWKEIIAYAKDKNVPIIFVCNDLKNDWYHFDGNKPTDVPRHELLKEFQDETGQLIWMYSLKGFISELEQRYKDSSELPLFSKLEAVKRVLIRNEYEQRLKHYKNGDDVLVVNCEACCSDEDEKDGIIVIRKDEIDWDWDGEYSDEREMGDEMVYTHHEYIECDNGHEITLTFRLWEYPARIVNYSEIECEGGEIVKEFDFSDTLEFDEPKEDDICIRCGAHGYANEMGLCIDCYREYREFMDKDD
ncbi:MAG: DUF4935 domain-containing protein [Prevotella sp.]|nr:DUF4935 domain-containing protein [Prevotella sp.]